MNKLYLLQQTINNGWDTYDSCVVVAPEAVTASELRPDSWAGYGHGEGKESYGTWCHPDHVKVTYLGIAAEHLKEGDVVCSSFNAG